MKKIIFSAMLLLSTSAFSYTFDDGKHSHVLSGNGVWKTAEGDSGTYTVQVETSHAAEGSVSISESIQAAGREMQITYQLVKTSEGFFDLMKDDEKVGDGYCFKMPEAKAKACHMSTSTGEHHGESTLHIDIANRTIHRMGSFLHQGIKIVWNDSLQVSSTN